MPLSQAQLIAGDSTKGVVLPGRAQGVVAGAGIAISPTGVISSTQPWTVSGNILSPSVIGNAVGIGTTTVKAGFLLQVNGGAVLLSPFANLALLQTETTKGYRWALDGDNLILQYTTDGFVANASTPITVTPANAVTLGSLAGAGTRMVTASATGVLSAQALPSEPWTQAGNNLYPTITTSNVALGGLTAAAAKLDILAGVYRGLFDDRAGGFTVTSVNAGNSAQSILTLQGSEVNLVTNGVAQIGVSTAGLVTVRSLSGTGTRMVTADASGVLSTQSIPAGGGDWTQAGTDLYPTATATTEVGIGLTTPQTRLHVSGGEITVSTGGFTPGEGGVINFGIASASTYSPMAKIQGALANAPGTELQGGVSFLTRPLGAAGQSLAERLSISSGGLITISNLSGTGTRMVVADANGLLSSAAIPAGTVTGVTGTLPIVSSGGAAPDISINAATTTTAGSMSSADKVKLDGLSQVWTQAGNSLYPTVSTSEVAIGGLTAAAAKLDILATTFRGLFDNRAGGFTISAVDPANTAYDVLALQGKTVNLVTAGVARISVAETGPVTVGNLAGAGTRMVVADATGVLSTQAVPGGGTVTDVTGTLPIVSSGGATPAISINAATTTTAGSMSSADKTKLDGLSQVWTQVGTNLYPTTTATTDVGIGTNDPQSRLQVVGGDFTVSNGGYAAGDGGAVNFGLTVLPAAAPMAKVQGLLANTATTEIQGGLGFFTRPVGTAGQTLQERINISAGGVVIISNLAGTGTRMVVADANGLLSSTAIPPTYTLPTRLGALAQLITDWNDAVENGWYAALDAENAPTPTGWYCGTVVSQNTPWPTQTVCSFTSDTAADTQTWQRDCNNGVWSAWYRLRISQEEQEALYPGTTGARASGTWGINVTGTAAALTSTAANWVTNGLVGANVVGLLGWKQYGNGHVIFDASAGTAPDGSAVNDTNATNPWQATFPTLMAWNGASTHGVRVDSARLANNLAITALPALP
jgi:hypothetical protein